MNDPTKQQTSTMQFVVAGGVFGALIGVLIGWMRHDVSDGVQAAVMSAFAFGGGLRRFTRSAAGSPGLQLDGRAAGLDAGEVLLFEGPANHWRGVESVGGRLYLTDARLRFRSHTLNVQTHDESYPLAAISAAEPARSLGVIPNGLKVTLTDGRVERFVVGGRATWVDRIRTATNRLDAKTVT